MRSRSSVPARALLPFALASALCAQTTPLPPASFGASVEVEWVEVEVFVTDATGAPVTGLSPADFALSVDGKPREIAGVYEARPRAELSPATVSLEPAWAPVPSAAPPPDDPPAERRLSLVVLLDELHLQPAGRKRTLERVAALIDERIAAGDEVMVATLDRSLQVRRGFADTGPLAATFAAVAKRAPGGVSSEIERRLALSQIRDIHASQGCAAIDLMQAIASSWAERVEQEARLTLSALEAMLESLAGRPGRKALLYVTEGMSLTPGLEAQLLVGELCSGAPAGASTGLVGPLSRVSRAANAAQVTLYTLDAGGQRVLASAVDGGPGLSMENQGRVRNDTQDPAFALAADTGGKALLESNRPELMIAALAQDLAAYYSLAFIPLPSDAGRAHRIGVEVRRPGVRVRHRSSWAPLPPEERLNGLLLAALRFGGEEANPLGALLESGAVHRDADGSFSVALRLLVPASAITLVPRGDRLQGSLRVLLAVRDGEGRVTPVRALPLPVDLATPPAGASAENAQVPLEVRLKLRRGRNTIGLVVHDEVGQQTSVVRREVVVGPPG